MNFFKHIKILHLVVNLLTKLTARHDLANEEIICFVCARVKNDIINFIRCRSSSPSQSLKKARAKSAIIYCFVIVHFIVPKERRKIGRKVKELFAKINRPKGLEFRIFARILCLS